jgi:DNA-binding HxlR family transcriptional regulator
VFPETPVRVEYQLTGKGRALQQVFLSIGEWADRWADCPDTSATGPDAA